MSMALLRKTWRDTWFVLLLATLSVGVFEVIFILAVSANLANMKQYIRTIPPFVQDLLKMLAGADILDHLTPSGLMSVGFAHPFVQLVIWSFTLAYCTRVIVGEIEAGTADLLMTLPVSRTRIYVTVSAVWFAAGAALAAMPWLGTCAGQYLCHKGPFDLGRLAMVSANLFCLYLAVGAGALWLSAISARRGRAIGILTGLLLGSFLLNFFAVIWKPAEKIAFLGVLNYYQPLPTIAGGEWPLRNMTVLLVATAICWTGGLMQFRRRDILTG